MWPLDDEVGDPRGEDDARRDGRLALAKPAGQHAVGQLQEEDDARSEDPLPELGGVEDEEDPVGGVQKVGEVEHLEESKKLVGNILH